MYVDDKMDSCPDYQYVTIHVIYVMITVSILCNPVKSVSKHQYNPSQLNFAFYY